ncbi:MAG: tetratricopeptide repeat protein [Deltaproteobacteria bacterium]|nr:tetratricopeptide repeat protein [Deltaproteobacteria bacterium]
MADRRTKDKGPDESAVGTPTEVPASTEEGGSAGNRWLDSLLARLDREAEGGVASPDDDEGGAGSRSPRSIEVAIDDADDEEAAPRGGLGGASDPAIELDALDLELTAEGEPLGADLVLEEEPPPLPPPLPPLGAMLPSGATAGVEGRRAPERGPSASPGPEAASWDELAVEEADAEEFVSEAEALEGEVVDAEELVSEVEALEGGEGDLEEEPTLAPAGDDRRYAALRHATVPEEPLPADELVVDEASVEDHGSQTRDFAVAAEGEGPPSDEPFDGPATGEVSPPERGDAPGASETESPPAGNLEIPAEGHGEPVGAEPGAVVAVAPSALARAVEEATAPQPDRMVRALSLEAEAGAETDRSRAATLWHEVGHLQDVRLGDASAAIKTFARVLQLDPGFKPNLWELRRLFEERQMWPNLLKLLDAQLRLETVPARRAEILLDRGWILEHRVTDLPAARQAYLAAHDENALWLAPLLALERLAQQQDDLASLAQAYRQMARSAQAPERQAVALRALAQLQDRLSSGSVEEGLSLLEEALSLEVERLPILEQMERLAARGGLVERRVSVLERLATELVRTGTEGPDRAVAVLRQAALVARVSLGDLARAQALLAQAESLLPDDAGLQRELLALAEGLGDSAELVRRLEVQRGRAADAEERAALACRIAWAEAQRGDEAAAGAAIDAALREVPGYLPALIEREWRALASGDVAALAEAWLREVELAHSGCELRGGRFVAEPQWEASALVRVAALLHRRAGDAERAIALCRRALAIQPGFTAAEEELAEALERGGRIPELLELREAQLAHASEERRPELLELLSELCAGPLDDPARQVGYLRRLEALQPARRSVTFRLLEALERAGDLTGLDRALAGLERSLDDAFLRRELQLRRAALLDEELGRPEEAVAIYRDILAASPSEPYAFAALEAILRREQRYAELALLVRKAADDATGPRRVAFLRQLGELYSRHLGQPDQAVEVYSRLLLEEPGERAAGRDLYRVALEADDRSTLLEVLEARLEGAHDAGERAGLALRLAELHAAAGRLDRADELLGSACRSDSGAAATEEARELLARRCFARGEYGEAARLLEELLPASPAEGRRLLLAELARLYEGPLGDPERGEEYWSELTAQDPGHRGAAWALESHAARRRDLGALTASNARLGELSVQPMRRADFLSRAALFAELTEERGGDASGLYRAALDADPTAVEPLVALLGRDEVDAEERATLLERLASRLPVAQRSQMHVPLAVAYEAAGRLQDAQREVTLALDLDRDDLPALLVLHRLTRAAGDVSMEARTALRLAELWPDAEARANWYRRAAVLMHQARDLPNAALVLRRLLGLDPQDERAFEDLRKICEDLGDHEGRVALLGHRLRYADQRSERERLHLERARLRLEVVGDRRGAAKDYLAVLELDEKHGEALQQLARLYDEDGQLSRAASYYHRYAETTDSPGQKREPMLRLSEILMQQRRVPEAVEVCRGLLELNPDDDGVLERLANLYEEMRDYPNVVRALERLNNLRSDRAYRARNSRRIGRIYWHELRRPNEAREALLSAQDQDPTSLEILGDLRQLCKATKAEDLGQLLDRAKDDVREVLMADPLSVELYGKLLRVAEWDEDQYTLLATLAVLCYLGAADPDDQQLYRQRAARLGFEPRRSLQAQAWREALVAPGARSAYGEIWAAIAPCVPRLFPDRVPVDLAAFGVGRADRIDRRVGGPVSSTLDRIAQAFGLSDFEIYVSRAQPDLVAGLPVEKQVLVVGHQVVANMGPAERFRVGRTISLLRERAQALEVLERKDLELLLAGSIFAVEPGASFELPRPQVEGAARRLQKAMSRRERKLLPLAVARFMQEGGEVDGWVRGVLATANRVGLLICGDLPAAMDQLVRDPSAAVGAPGRATARIVEAIRAEPQATQLLLYSVSRDYLSLRRELQL